MGAALAVYVPLFAFMLIPVWIPLFAVTIGAIGDLANPRRAAQGAGAAVASAKARTAQSHQSASPATSSAAGPAPHRVVATELAA